MEVIAELGNHRILVEQDPDAEDPRKWDNVGTMVCSHRRYTLGDEKANTEYYGSWDDWLEYNVIARDGSFELPDSMPERDEYTNEEYDAAYEEHRLSIVETRRKNIVVLPLYLYDHGGITMYTSDANRGHDPWDSGQVGFIYVWKEDALKAGAKEETWAQEAEAWLRSEVETYDTWLRGDYVYLQLEKFDEALGDWERVDCIGSIESGYISQAIVDCFGKEYAELAEKVA